MAIKSKALLRNDRNLARQSVPTRESPREDIIPDEATIDQTILATMPDDYPGNVFPFNLVRADVEGDDITFTAPCGHLVAGARFRVTMDGELDETELPITQPDVDAGFFTLTVAWGAWATSEMHIFQYETTSPFEFDWTNLSEPHHFTLDFIEPAQPKPGELEPPADVVQDGLTDQKLTELNDVLECSIPSYADRQWGDIIVGYLQLDPVSNPGAPVVESERVQIAWGSPLTDPVNITFTREQIEEVGDGLVRLTYKVFDMAGNESAESHEVWLRVLVSGAIDDLEPPLVPAYEDDEDDQLIDETDARTPVIVQIPGNARIEVGYEIVVTWGTRAAPGKTFSGPDNEAPTILDVDVPYAIVLSEWEAGPQDANGNVNIDVGYVVFSGDQAIGQPVNKTPVVVNLSQAGGPDPNPETPENEALGAPTVRHSQWQDAGRENFIPNASLEEDHVFIVPWFIRDENGAITGDDAFKVSDQIVCRYGEGFTEPLQINNTHIVDKQDLEIELPWEIVKAEGSGTHEAQFIVERTLLPDGQINVSRSPLTMVVAEDVGDNPGGGEPLPLPVFDDQFVVWSVVDKAGYAALTIPAYEGMKIDDRVRVHVTANYWEVGDDDFGDPVDVAEWGGENNENPHDIYPFEIVITDDNIDTDLKFGWPKELCSLVHPYGKARIRYYVTRANGSGKTEQTGIDWIVDMSHKPKPPDPETLSTRASRRPLKLADIKRLRSAEERTAALRAYVKFWRTTLAHRRLRRDIIQSRLAAAGKLTIPDKNLSARTRKLAEMASRPTPDPFRKE